MALTECAGALKERGCL